ncbi:MAG: thioesterase [Alphaproteobacteria bacterium]|nr:MAG: thioesterase [Alphaproteobacteria bacterium]
MILTFLSKLKARETFEESLDISPYAKMMGFRLRRQDGILTTVMDFHDDLIGSPFPKALHGGTVASLLEMAALMQLTWDRELAHIPKALDVTIDYLRSGKPEDTFARARVFRMGRRFATLHAEAWQSDSEKPIASAMLHFQLVK